MQTTYASAQPINAQLSAAFSAYYNFIADNNPYLPENEVKAEKLYLEYQRLASDMNGNPGR